MPDKSAFDFTKFVPGFDFLKNLGSGGAAAASPTPGWVAPTLDPAELDRRIQELKTVHFWLDQNTKAVSATIQALEVQRMTLSALQGMNVSISEMAESLKIKPERFATPGFAQEAEASPAAAPQRTAPKKRAAKPTAKASSPSSKSAAAGAASAGEGAIDPGQWWGALTQQFQTIAHSAMQEMAKNAATHPGSPAPEAAGASSAAKAAGAASTQTAAKSRAKAKPRSKGAA